MHSLFALFLTFCAFAEEGYVESDVVQTTHRLLADPARGKIDTDRYPNRALNFVDREMRCLIKKEKSTKTNTPKPLTLLNTHDTTINLINLLSPYFADGFGKFSDSKYGYDYVIDSRHRSLFYSQTVVESGGYNKLSETDDYSRLGSSGECKDLGVDQLIKELEQKDNSTCRVGRGIFQTTGVANYMASLHYFAQMRTGKEPVWRTTWFKSYPPPLIPDREDPNYEAVKSKYKKNVFKEMTCDSQTVETLLSTYKKEFHTDLPNRETLSNLNMFSAPCMRLKVKGAGGKEVEIKSEGLIASSAMAYYRGACGAITQQLLHPSKSEKARKEIQRRCGDSPKPSKGWSVPSQGYTANTAGAYSDEFINYCTTICVRGQADGWEERYEYYKMARTCEEAAPYESSNSAL